MIEIGLIIIKLDVIHVEYDCTQYRSFTILVDIISPNLQQSYPIPGRSLSTNKTPFIGHVFHPIFQ